MDNNAKLHRSHIVDDLLEEEDDRRMYLPLRSSDLNPAKYNWNSLGIVIGEHNPLPELARS